MSRTRYGGCACGCDRAGGGCNCGPRCKGCKCFHLKRQQDTILFGGNATPFPCRRPRHAANRRTGGGFLNWLWGAEGENETTKGIVARRDRRGRSGGAVTAPTDIPAEITSMEGKMLALWDDHGYWTRMVVMAKVSKLTTEETSGYVERLLQNQDQIAYYFVPRFGRDAAESVSKLLREHIALAAQLVDALAGSGGNADEIKTSWFNNAEQIGSALYDLQNKFGGSAPGLSKSQWISEMKMHLELLTTLVGAYVGGKFQDALIATDPYMKHIRHLAVAISKLVSPGRMLWPFGPFSGYSYAYRPLQPIPNYPAFDYTTAGPPYRYRTQTVYS